VEASIEKLDIFLCYLAIFYFTLRKVNFLIAYKTATKYQPLVM